MKRCSRCKVEKQERDFGVDRRNKSGLMCSCRECTNAFNKVSDRKQRATSKYKTRKSEWWRDNRGRYNERIYAKRRANPEANKKQRRDAYARNPELYRKYARDFAKKWRAANPDASRAKAKAAYRKYHARILAAASNKRRAVAALRPARVTKINWRDPLEVKRYHSEQSKKKAAERRESRRRWASMNAQKVKADRAKWLAANRNKMRAAQQRYRASKRTSKVERIDFDRICKRDRMICHVCKKPVTKKQLHFDHVIPLAAGGPHIESNIAVAHAFCNISKGAKVLTLF